MTESAGGGGELPQGPVGNVTSLMNGSAVNVVQARDISGGVHFHHAERTTIPRQIPNSVPRFVGRAPELAALTRQADEAGTIGVAMVSTVVALDVYRSLGDQLGQADTHQAFEGHEGVEPSLVRK